MGIIKTLVIAILLVVLIDLSLPDIPVVTMSDVAKVSPELEGLFMIAMPVILIFSSMAVFPIIFKFLKGF